MANGLRNAGFLDGSEGWGQALLTMSVDEAVLGAPGRAVLRGYNAGVSGSNVVVSLESAADNALAVSPDDTIEASAWWLATGGAANVKVDWRTSGGSQISTSVVPMVSAGGFPALLAAGMPLLGAKAQFNRSWGHLVAPATAAKARLLLTATVVQDGTSATLGLVKPALQIAGAQAPAPWDPGSHANTDLAGVAAWPDSLPPFRDPAQATPYPNRAAFTGDSNIPMARRLYAAPQHEFRGQMRLSQLQYAALMAFFCEAADQVFLVRPDTDELCFASWLAGGAPKVVQQSGPWLIAEVGLKLRVA